jgi:hypothetical protein
MQSTEQSGQSVGTDVPYGFATPNWPVSRFRWSAALAGAVVFLSTAALLWGLALSVTSLLSANGTGGFRTSGITLWICAMVATILGALAGGTFAGRTIAGAPRSWGAAHGLVAWGLSLLVALGLQLFMLRGFMASVTFEAPPETAQNGQNGMMPDVDSARADRTARDLVRGVGWSWFGTWLAAAIAACAAGASASGGQRIPGGTLRDEREVPLAENRRGPMTPSPVR